LSALHRPHLGPRSAIALAVALIVAAALQVGLADGTESPQGVMDGGFWGSSLWEDGRAEIAFYHLSIPQVREPVLAGSLLVRHHLDRRSLTKLAADEPAAEEAWQWIVLYGFDTPGAGPSRRFFQLDARRRDLQPWRFTSVERSWEGHCAYNVALDAEETFLRERGTSCDTFLPLPGLERAHLYEAATYLRAQMPLVVRGVDFRHRPVHEINVFAAGRRFTARLERLGVDTLRLPGGAEEAERIAVEYDGGTPSLPSATAPAELFGTVAAREVYWRRTGGNRQILKVEAEGYGMTLIEEIRAKHWDEDFFPRLERVRRYP